MKRVITGFFILLAGYSVCQAQIDTLKQQAQTPPAAEKWSLQKCIEYALANNLNVQRTAYDVESSEVDLRQAHFSRLPSVNGNASYGYSWGRGLDPVSNSFVSQEIKSSNLSANASLPLFNGMRIHNTVKQNQRFVAATEQDLAKAKNDLILNVANLFINVVFNKELVENAKFQLASSQQQLERTRKQVAAGSLPRSEELNLDAQAAGNEVTLVQQENALALSILQLKQALQIPASQGLDVEIPGLDPEELVIDQTRDEIYDIARQTMPEIKSAEYRIQSSYYAVKSSRGSLYPRLSLVAGLNTNYSSTQESQFYADPNGGFSFSQSPVAYLNQDLNSPVYTVSPNGTYRDTYGFGSQVKDNIYRTLGLQLIIPIFNNFSARATVQRTVIQNQQAKIDAQLTDQTLRQNVETAYNDAVAAAKTYNSSLRQVNAREEAFRMMEQRYGAGSANSFEFQVSQNDLFRAKTDLSRAKYDFIFKKKVLDFYQGKPLEY
ncbi:TolC family protein [Ohtaekwangia koreensis]|uniref:Outer membrane protein n=1 Tax=Ohtaekwangia koreensis TaxID=688867 RepID=A0A1T5K8V6_9BACT|nr:TolC family protein [Ohtaekwangia koreensis]SKC60137.1 outer membrane protein [Ohtaekwangia koreensis]